MTTTRSTLAAPRTMAWRRLFSMGGSGGGFIRGRSHSSSAATTDAINSSTFNHLNHENNRRVSLTLYRQLLRWCRETSPALPLSSVIPPIHIRSPEHVDTFRLQHVFPSSRCDEDKEEPIEDTALRRARHLVLMMHTRHRIQIDQSSLTVPVHSSNDLRRFFQIIFRLNANEQRQSEYSYHKQRVSVAFEALKSLNELSSNFIDSLWRRRFLHQDRSTVLFRIGQVVQHKDERWRGVISSWVTYEHGEEDDSNGSTLPSSSLVNRKSSLTSKSYTVGTLSTTTTDDKGDGPTTDHHIRYHVILDEGDAHLMGVSSPTVTAIQRDLVLINDPDLCRIRSRTVSEHFVAYDPTRREFVPNELHSFEYPLDVAATAEGVTEAPPRLSEDEQALCSEVVNGCKDLAMSLKCSVINELTDAAASTSTYPQIVVNVLERLDSLIEGDVLPMSVRFAIPCEPSLATSATHSLRAWLHLQHEIMEVMFNRKLSQEHKHRLHFSLGDIVRHKLFGFRGVVVAWDPKPTMDVSRWDGLQHIDDPMSQPFYQVIPDPQDCLEAFGAERPMRYVCQSNLEACPEHLRTIQVDLDPPDWTRCPTGDRYIPSDALRFKFAEDADDRDGRAERCMTEIQETINRWQCESRDPSKNDGPLSMGKILRLLQIVDNLHDAMVVQEVIKETRKAHPQLELRRRLEDGLSELMMGNGDKALSVYRSIVEQDPDTYPEIYNKIATCQFMMGRIEEAQVATNKALELDPIHVQALNGLGLIHFEKGEYQQAIDAFRKSISIDPWSPVTAKLSVSIDLLNSRTENDE